MSRSSLPQPLPPIEHRPDGSTYRMTPAQRKKANALIRKECCNCDHGNCLMLDDGDGCVCPQIISSTVLCKWFRHAVLPLDPELEAEIFEDRGMKSCAVCGCRFVPKSNRARYCPACAKKVKTDQAAERKHRQRDKQRRAEGGDPSV